jgi:hypothetical protein
MGADIRYGLATKVDFAHCRIRFGSMMKND